MNPAEYYYQNGCTVCEKGRVIFIDNNFIYRCVNCKASASAHRKESKYAKKYEPYQYLANEHINELRRELESRFNMLWQQRVNHVINDKLTNSAIINLVFNANIKIYTTTEPQYVKIIYHDVEQSICDLYSYDKKDVLNNIDYNKLKNITNRQKTYLWLAEQLDISVATCQIGYLSESQLKDAIDLCTKTLSDARHISIESYSTGS